MPGGAFDPTSTTGVGRTAGGYDRLAADCYKMIRDTRVKVDVPDHKGSTALCDENLEWYRKVNKPPKRIPQRPAGNP